MTTLASSLLGSWPRTRHFGLAVPKPGLLKFAAKVEEACGDQVEVVGENVRAAVTTPGIAAGMAVTFTGLGSDGLEAVDAEGGLSSGISRSAGERVLVDLIAVLSLGSGEEDVGLGGVVIGGPAGISTISPDEVPVLEDGPERSVSNPVGFAATGTNAAVLDSTGPLLIHATQALTGPTADTSLANTSTVEETFGDPGVILRISFVAAPDIVTIWWPVWVPADFSSAFSGATAPVFVVHAVYSDLVALPGSDATVTLAFVDSAGSVFAAAPVVVGSQDIGFSVLETAVLTPGTLCWLKATFSADPAVWVDVGMTASWRYQQQKRGS